MLERSDFRFENHCIPVSIAIMQRLWIVPLLMALVLTQGYHSSVSTCFDQLGLCASATQTPESQHCSCDAEGHGDLPSQPLAPCDDSCGACHIDHVEWEPVAIGAQIDRIEISRVEDRVLSQLPIMIGMSADANRFRSSLDPPGRLVTKQFCVWIM